MPIVEIEVAPGTWVRQEVTTTQRRNLLADAPADSLFITPEGIVQIPHAANLWNFVTGRGL